MAPALTRFQFAALRSVLREPLCTQCLSVAVICPMCMVVLMLLAFARVHKALGEATEQAPRTFFFLKHLLPGAAAETVVISAQVAFSFWAQYQMGPMVLVGVLQGISRVASSVIQADAFRPEMPSPSGISHHLPQGPLERSARSITRWALDAAVASCGAPAPVEKGGGAGATEGGMHHQGSSSTNPVVPGDAAKVPSGTSRDPKRASPLRTAAAAADVS